MPNGITIEEYEEEQDNNSGYCTTCDCITQCGGVEPDARGYTCPDCGQPTMMGLAECLLEGFVS